MRLNAIKGEDGRLTGEIVDEDGNMVVLIRRLMFDSYDRFYTTVIGITVAVDAGMTEKPVQESGGQCE